MSSSAILIAAKRMCRGWEVLRHPVVSEQQIGTLSDAATIRCMSDKLPIDNDLQRENTARWEPNWRHVECHRATLEEDRLSLGAASSFNGTETDRMAASGPQVVLSREKKKYEPVFVAAPKTAWRYVGWLGLVLAVSGGVDIALRWYPLAFKSPEWEFGTVGITVGSLPLFAIGLVLLLAASLARASSLGVSVMAAVFGVLSVFLAGALMVFMLDIPLALRVNDPAQAAVRLEIKKTILRTLVIGGVFEAMFIACAVVSIRYIFRRVKDA
jgi:hypothetical protein